jgi:sulfide:quinone oxidoreductase
MKSFDVVVIGGGTGGICTAARLRRAAPRLSVAVVEPSGNHFYQPAFTFVACGLMPPELSARPMSDVIPEGCTWIRDAVSSIEAENNQIQLSGGEKITYRALVVSPGLSVDLDSVSGLADALNDRKQPVCSIYDPANIGKFRDLISQFIGGTIIFSLPSGPLKCSAATLKILILADDILRNSGVREMSRLIFVTPYSSIFGIAGFAETMNDVFKKRGVDVLFEHEVLKIDSRNQVLHLTPSTEAAAQRNIKSLKYDVAHITPHMKAPQFIAASNLHHSEGRFQSWLDVNPLTLQHTRFINIFGVGDVAGIPNIKTASAARAQAKVAAENICFLFKKGAQLPLPRKYNGYSLCPLVTGIGQALHPELGYDGQLLPSLPVNPYVPRNSLWFYNIKVLPRLYWNFMIKGIL